MKPLVLATSGWAIWLAMTTAAPVDAGPAGNRFIFREPSLQAYRVAEAGPRLQSAIGAQAWVSVVRDDGGDAPFKLGSRVILRTQPGSALGSLLADSALTMIETAAPNLYVLQAGDAWAAAAEAQRLSAQPAVLICHPEMKRPIKLHRAYAPYPNDPYFNQQWHLEYRSNNGARLGPDVNARAAWPSQDGASTIIAVVDEGVELNHPDLQLATAGMPHYNFYAGTSNGGPISPVSAHGTAVAGLAAAAGNNGIGVSGVAPGAHVASWIIFDLRDVAADQQLRDMFQYHSNTVPIQNHSWSFSYFQQLAPGPLEEIGISNAITLGRDGKGVVMIRSAGNDRVNMVNANDDGYTKNPRIVTVAAVRKDGQVTSYSNPGACILVAGLSGDGPQGFADVLTTDMLGSDGLNRAPGTSDFSNYTFFSGTSAAAPTVSGVVALILDANPALTYRDIQHILINSARQTDPADPLMKTNQAGYRVNLNTGFGVPDAGRAVRLARTWPLRPAMTNVIFINDQTNQIPNQGLRVETFGPGVSIQLASIIATPGVGLHPEDLTPFYPVVDVGFATNAIATDLTGKAALIRRGANTFLEKINFAAQAGARLAIVANQPTDNELIVMSGTYRAPIPAVFIGGPDGEALRTYLGTNTSAQVRSILFTATYTNHVNTPLSLEHVGVRIKSDHPHRGDLRITVTSPAGTRSVLQHINDDFTGGPVDWTYWSTQHFYESSQGVWSIQLSDENRVYFGDCLYAELILEGTAIIDQDRDGLDDNWERTHFGSLAARPNEDADDDGETNISEYLQGTDPLSAPAPLMASITQWNTNYVRLGWPGNPHRSFQVLGATNVTAPFTVLTNLPGTFETGEWFVPSTNAWQRFFQLRSTLP